MDWKVLIDGAEFVGVRSVPLRPEVIFPAEKRNLVGAISGLKDKALINSLLKLQAFVSVSYYGPLGDHYQQCTGFEFATVEGGSSR
jgi:hypothetical protein